MTERTDLIQHHLIVVPGVHAPELTHQFLQGLRFPATNQQQPPDLNPVWIVPIDRVPPYSALQILHFLQQHYDPKAALLFVCFSAGVVGGIGAALGWQALGGTVTAFIALDGWGVPLLADFPIHRLSHDYFTHWSSSLLGTGKTNFYADPAVDHLDLWRSPQAIWGWSLHQHQPQRMTAALFLNDLLQQYGQRSLR